MDFTTHFIKQREKLLERGIMVDVETAGPALHKHPLLSLGSNKISDPKKKFYVELKPDKLDFVPEALAVTGFTLDGLMLTGIDPKKALQDFLDWVADFRIKDPIFVARCANFDWKFFDYYVLRYIGVNPFGYFAFDTISAFGTLFPNREVPHHAGQDALIQTQDLLKFFKTF